MQRPEIRKTDYLTPQELLMTGGSPDPVVGEDRWYVPEGFSKRFFNWKEADKVRQKIKFIDIPPSMLSFLGEEVEGLNLKLKLAKLENGETLRDPVIVEVKSVTEGERARQKAVERRDLTRKFYNLFKEKGLDLHLRPSGIKKEGNFASSEQKG